MLKAMANVAKTSLPGYPIQSTAIHIEQETGTIQGLISIQILLTP